MVTKNDIEHSRYFSTIFMLFHRLHAFAHFRYMETGYHISSWYRMTPWDVEKCNKESTVSIEIVNKYHQDAALLCRKHSRDERREKAVSILEKLLQLRRHT